MSPGSHLFVVDKYSFPVHADRLFCGVKYPLSRSNQYGVYADLLATRPGDFVFFYQRRVDEPPNQRGFRGIFKVAGPPFIDRKTIESGGNQVLGECPKCHELYSEKAPTGEEESPKTHCPKCHAELDATKHILPNRLPLELVAHYERPIDDNSAYIDRTDPGSLWTLIFRKQFGAGRERSINHILPEEAEKIRRLLNRANPDGPTPLPKGFPKGYPSSSRSPLPFNLPTEAPFTAESALYAWLNQNVDSVDKTLRAVLGPAKDMEYFGNQVLYGIGGDTADYIVLHTKRPGEAQSLDDTNSSSYDKSVVEQGGRFAVTVIEIKKDEVDLDTLAQVDRYAYYVGQVASANCLPAPPRSLLVRPVLLGFDATPDLLSALKDRKERSIPLSYPGGNTTNAVVVPPKVLTYDASVDGLRLTKVV